MTTSRRKRPEPQDRSPYPENLRAIIYRCGLQDESAHWVNEHWDDGIYFPAIQRQRPDNFDRTLRRWLRGEGIAQTEIDEILYAGLSERHGVPQEVIQQMVEATGEMPRFDPIIPFEERVDLWQANRARLEAEFQKFGEARVRYSLFVFGAHTIEDFSSKIYSLVERPFSEDGGGWVMFDDELRKIVGLTLPEAKQPDRLPIGCSYFGLNYSGRIKPTGILSAGGLP